MNEDIVGYIIATLLSKPHFACTSVCICNGIIELFGCTVLRMIKKMYGSFYIYIVCFTDLFYVEKQAKNDVVYLIASIDYCILNYPECVKYAYMNEELFKATNCLHAGQVKTTTTKRDLWNFFGEYANVKNIRIKKIRNENVNGRIYNRRIAFIEFYSIDDARRVKSLVNRSDLWKGTLQFAKSK